MPEQCCATEARDAALVDQAFELFRESTDWVAFYRQVLGLNGLVRRTLPTPQKLAEFERSDAYEEILLMLARLRERSPGPETPQEPTRVVTVRLPRSVHETLRYEAHERQTSMNKLCISKLVRSIDGALVPKEGWRASEADNGKDVRHLAEPFTKSEE